MELWLEKGPYWQPLFGERLVGSDLSLDADGLTTVGCYELCNKERSNRDWRCKVRPGSGSQQRRSGASARQYRYCVASRVSKRVGEEVLVEGATPPGGELIDPSLKVIREGHSLPLILKNQALHMEVRERLIVARMTNLSTK